MEFISVVFDSDSVVLLAVGVQAFNYMDISRPLAVSDVTPHSPGAEEAFSGGGYNSPN